MLSRRALGKKVGNSGCATFFVSLTPLEFVALIDSTAFRKQGKSEKNVYEGLHVTGEGSKRCGKREILPL